MMDAVIPLGSAIFGLVVSIFFVWMLLTFLPVRLWIEAWAAGVPIGLGTLIGMRLRKVRPEAVVRPMIMATKAGVQLHLNELEAHHLAGGRVDDVVRALISADKAGIDWAFQQVAAIDLAGGDIGEQLKQRIVIESGEAHEMACPRCGKRFEIDRHILMGFIEALRDYPPFQDFLRPKG